MLVTISTKQVIHHVVIQSFSSFSPCVRLSLVTIIKVDTVSYHGDLLDFVHFFLYGLKHATQNHTTHTTHHLVAKPPEPPRRHLVNSASKHGAITPRV